MRILKELYFLPRNTTLAIFALLSAISISHAQVATLTAGCGADSQVLGVHASSSDPFWSNKFSDALQGPLGGVEVPIGNVEGKGSGGSGSVMVGASPIFRLTMVDKKRTNASKEMGTHFQFGDMLGVGVRLAADQVHLGYRFIHYSNAGISSSNPGLDLHTFSFKVSF